MRILCLSLIAALAAGPAAAKGDCVLERLGSCEAASGCAGYERLDTSRSKFVQSGYYSAADRCLLLRLEGAPVRHCNVPAAVWRKLKKSSNLGLYYNTDIDGHYECARDETVP